MFKKIIKYFQIKYYKIIFSWKYKWVDPKLCCCGSAHCLGDYSHCFRSSKEYAITEEVLRSVTKNI